MSPQIMSDTARNAKNLDIFREELELYTHAAIGIFLIRTREDMRCRDAIYEFALREEADFWQWKANTGWEQFPSDQRDNEFQSHEPVKKEANTIAPDKAVEFLTDKDREEGIYCMIAPTHFFDKALIIQHIKDFNEQAREKRKRLVLIVHETAKVPPELEDIMHYMDFSPPSHAELRELWDNFQKDVKEDTPNLHVEFDDEDITRVIQNAIGATAREFEDAISVATIQYGDKLDADESYEVTPDDFVKVLLDQKVEIIKRSDILELVPAVDIGEVGGYDVLKAWLTERHKSFSDDAKQFGITPPSGIMCIGPPGTGKSLIGKATASVFGTALIKFDVGRVFNKHVGSSEENVRNALKMVDSMAPCVLFCDEIDKGFGNVGGGGDSGVSDRVFGTFLTWMQERKLKTNAAPVFVIMTANRVTDLPPELMRKGRLDEIFACTFPSASERADILNIHLKKRGHKFDKKDLQRLAVAANNFVGAELEQVIVDGLLTHFNKFGGDKKAHPLAVETFLEKVTGTRPLFQTFKPQVRAMNDFARDHAKAASSGMSFDNSELDAPATPAPGSAPGKRQLSLPRRSGPIKANKASDR